MITRITLVIGEIYELNGNSEPLYLWDGIKFIEITPREYNVFTETVVEKRLYMLKKLRLIKEA